MMNVMNSDNMMTIIRMSNGTDERFAPLHPRRCRLLSGLRQHDTGQARHGRED
jgi:hypothetical protein